MLWICSQDALRETETAGRDFHLTAADLLFIITELAGACGLSPHSAAIIITLGYLLLVVELFQSLQVTPESSLPVFRNNHKSTLSVNLAI